MPFTGGLRRDSFLSSFGRVTIKSVFGKGFLCSLPRPRGAPFLPPRRLCFTLMLHARWSHLKHLRVPCDQRGCTDHAQRPIFGANRLCPYSVVNKNIWMFGKFAVPYDEIFGNFVPVSSRFLISNTTCFSQLTVVEEKVQVTLDLKWAGKYNVVRRDYISIMSDKN